MNADKVRKHKDEAARQMAKGRLKEALDELMAVQKMEPGDLANRQKVGDLHAKLGNKAEAIKAYQAVSGAYAADGLLLKGIAVCKLILQLDPGHSETQRALADLYGKKRGDVAHAEMPAAMSAALGGAGQKMSASMIRGAPVGGLGSRRPDETGPQRIPTQPPPIPLDLMPPRQATALPPPPPQDGIEIDLDSNSGEMVLEIEHTSAREPPAPAVIMGQPILPPAPAYPVPGTMTAGAAAGSWGQPAPQPAPVDLGPAGPADLEDIEMVSPPPAPPAEGGGMLGGEEDFSDFDLDNTAPARVDLSKLPPIPLFSDLSKNAFIELMERMEIRVMTPGEPIIIEGEVGNSFYIIASGQVRIEKHIDGETVVLAQLADGAFFGEIALLSDSPRTASVVADTDVELFEISREVINAVIKEYPSVHHVMMRFYKQRLLSNLLNTSPIFRKFDKVQRKQLIEMFRSREVASGDPVITEGQKGDGLYVLLSGRCKVMKHGAAVATLKEGDVFGEMSLLTRDPVSASVMAAGRVMVLRLPRKQFNEVIMTHPQVLEMISEISAARQRRN